LTVADAITRRRLNSTGQTSIAKKVDLEEQGAKPKNISTRIFRIDEVARAGFKHGIDKVDAGSLADFLSSPMRANLLRIETPESANGTFKLAGSKGKTQK
jgi:hypothetical protein